MADQKSVGITISNAVFTGEDGTVHKGTIKGDATLTQPPTMPPGIGDHPEHPILLPPPSTGDQFWLLCYVTEPPPPHWEWISFSPGDPPERPQPQPPEPPDEKPPVGIVKPFPPDGGWGYMAPWGWIYWPGPSGAGPKK